MAQISDTPEGRVLRHVMETLDATIKANNGFMLQNDDNQVQELLEAQLNPLTEFKKLIQIQLILEGLED